LVNSLRAPQLAVKEKVFRILGMILQRVHWDPSEYLSKLPIARLKKLAQNRTRLEQTEGTQSVYLQSLLHLVGIIESLKLQSLANEKIVSLANGKSIATVPLALAVSSQLPNDLTVEWNKLCKIGDQEITYIVESCKSTDLQKVIPSSPPSVPNPVSLNQKLSLSSLYLLPGFVHHPTVFLPLTNFFFVFSNRCLGNSRPGTLETSFRRKSLTEISYEKVTSRYRICI
jgi:hypothetical protein